MDKPRIAYPDYLLNMLDARQKAAVLGHSSPTPAATPEQLRQPVTLETVLKLAEHIGAEAAQLAKRIAVLEGKHHHD